MILLRNFMISFPISISVSILFQNLIIHFRKIQYFFKVLKTDCTIQYFFNNTWEPWPI